MGRHSCCLKQKLRKGLWSPEEDEKLYNYITRFGVGCWSSVPKLAGLQRCGKSCRLRWINYLRPDLKRGMFSQQEEDLIIRLHEVLGNRWAQIAAQLPGRTDNEIKNFWNSCLKKKLLKQGIDPNTHQPLTENQVRDEKSCTDKASLQTSQPIGIPHSSISSGMEKAFQMSNTNFCAGGQVEAPRGQAMSKQVFDPLFLLEFQASLDPCGYHSNFLNQNAFEGNPNHSFNSLPNLTNSDHRNMTDIEFSDNSSSRMISSLLINEAKTSLSPNSSNTSAPPATHQMNNFAENANTFSWDANNKFESVFQYQFNGIKAEEMKSTPWREGQLHTQNSGDFSNYPLTSLSAEDLSGANLDVFHHI